VRIEIVFRRLPAANASVTVSVESASAPSDTSRTTSKIESMSTARVVSPVTTRSWSSVMTRRASVFSSSDGLTLIVAVKSAMTESVNVPCSSEQIISVLLRRGALGAWLRFDAPKPWPRGSLGSELL